MAGFPANGTPYRGRYYGAPVIAQIISRVLNSMTTWALTTNARDIRVQDQSSPYTWAFRGDAGPLQSFRGAAGFVGASPAGIRPGFNTVLPGTTALPSQLHGLLPGNPGG